MSLRVRRTALSRAVALLAAFVAAPLLWGFGSDGALGMSFGGVIFGGEREAGFAFAAFDEPVDDVNEFRRFFGGACGGKSRSLRLLSLECAEPASLPPLLRRAFLSSRASFFVARVRARSSSSAFTAARAISSSRLARRGPPGRLSPSVLRWSERESSDFFRVRSGVACPKALRSPQVNERRRSRLNALGPSNELNEPAPEPASLGSRSLRDLWFPAAHARKKSERVEARVSRVVA